ncbi:MAG: hypothetical protein AAGA65_04000 [Actinomycetota bacterium]
MASNQQRSSASRPSVGGPVPAAGALGDVVSALEHFEASLAAFRTGVLEIEASPSYLMLTDEDLTGETARRYGAAARDASDLWTFIEAAEAQLQAARAHYSRNGAVGSNGRELRRLLEEPWFAITDLAGQAPQNYSVTSTLAQVRRRYQAIRAGVTEIEQLWVSVLPRVDSARTTLARLQAEADELRIVEPLIGRAKALADDLAERLVDDPASVSVGDGSNLDTQVSKAAKQMAILRAGHDNLDSDFEVTEELLASLRVLRARAEAARVEAVNKITDPEHLVRVPSEQLLDGPDGMAKRLDALFDAASTAAWTQKRTMLDGWLTTARKLEAQLVRAGEVNRAPIEVRNELRGRLQAYAAKIAAIGRSEDLELADLVDRARAELYTAPTDLAAAEAAITDLATRLRA